MISKEYLLVKGLDFGDEPGHRLHQRRLGDRLRPHNTHRGWKVFSIVY